MLGPLEQDLAVGKGSARRAQGWALTKWPLHARSALRTLGMSGGGGNRTHFLPSRETDKKPDSYNAQCSGLRWGRQRLLGQP